MASQVPTTAITNALKQKLPGLQAKEIKDIGLAIAALQSHGLQVEHTFPTESPCPTL